MNLLTEKLKLLEQEKKDKLLPENIRQGQTVFGVTGTLPAPADNRLVRIYPTVEAMEADTEIDLDDKAMVYDITTELLNYDSVFSIYRPLSTAKFDETIVDTHNVVYNYSDNTTNLRATLNIKVTPTTATITSNYQNSGNNYANDTAEIKYTSEDGMTYVMSSYKYTINRNESRMTQTTNTIDIYLWTNLNSDLITTMTGDFDVCAAFISVKHPILGGLYQYRKAFDETKVQTVKNIVRNDDYESSEDVYRYENGPIVKFRDICEQIHNYVANNILHDSMRIEHWDSTVIFTDETHCKTSVIFRPEANDRYYVDHVRLAYRDGIVYNAFPEYYIEEHESQPDMRILTINVDLVNGTCTHTFHDFTEYDENYIYTPEEIEDPYLYIDTISSEQAMFHYYDPSFREEYTDVYNIESLDIRYKYGEEPWWNGGMVNIAFANLPSWRTLVTQLSLQNASQLLQNVTGFGASNVITGDGTFMKYINQGKFIENFMPSIENIPKLADGSVLKYGSQVKAGTFVEYEEVPYSDFSTLPDSTCVIRKSNTETIQIPDDIKTQWNSCQVQYSIYSISDNKPFQVTIGVNYSASGSGTSYKYLYVTKIVAAVVNLTTGEVCKRVNWTGSTTVLYTGNTSTSSSNFGFDHLGLYYNYSTNTIKMLIGPNQVWSGNLHLGCLTIDGNNNVSAIYGNPSHSYTTYASVEYMHYDDVNNCFWGLTYAGSNANGYGYKDIVKINSSLSSFSVIKNVNSNMSNISSDAVYCWENILQSSPVLRYREGNSTYVHNLQTGNRLAVDIGNAPTSTYFAYYNGYIYTMAYNTSTSRYEVCKINMSTMAKTVIPNIPTYTSRYSHIFEFYNNELCIFINSKIYDTNGNALVNSFNPSWQIGTYNMLNSLGIDYSNKWYVCTLYNDYIDIRRTSYKYYKYDEIEQFPTSKEIGIIMGNTSITNTSSMTNKYYKYQCYPITKKEEV